MFVIDNILMKKLLVNINYAALHILAEQECLSFHILENKGRQSRGDKFVCNTTKG